MYAEVLNCLLEEGGLGYDASMPGGDANTGDADRMNFIDWAILASAIYNVGIYALKNTITLEGVADDAPKLIQHASELREFVSRIKLPSDTNSDDKDYLEEEDINAEAVCRRLNLKEKGRH